MYSDDDLSTAIVTAFNVQAKALGDALLPHFQAISRVIEQFGGNPKTEQNLQESPTAMTELLSMLTSDKTLDTLVKTIPTSTQLEHYINLRSGSKWAFFHDIMVGAATIISLDHQIHGYHLGDPCIFCGKDLDAVGVGNYCTGWNMTSLARLGQQILEQHHHINTQNRRIAQQAQAINNLEATVKLVPNFRTLLLQSKVAATLLAETGAIYGNVPDNTRSDMIRFILIRLAEIVADSV